MGARLDGSLPGPSWTTLDQPWTYIQDTINTDHVHRKWSIPSQAAHGWFDSIYWCVGVKVSPVGNISIEVNLQLKNFNIAQFLKHGLTSILGCSQIDVETYQELWTNVDRELGPAHSRLCAVYLIQTFQLHQVH